MQEASDSWSKCRLKLAVDAATPLIEPKTLEEGAALASRIAVAGNAMTWKVILLINATYAAAI